MSRALILSSLAVLSFGLSGCIIYDGPEDGLHITTASKEAERKSERQSEALAVTRTYAGSFPIAQAVTVPAGYRTIYLSGLLPDVADANAPKGSIESYGNTEVQTDSVLKKIEAALKQEGATLGDVVNMKVYLVGDPKLDGKMDFGGMMKAYTRYFGTEAQPNKPSRATVQVAGLVASGYLVEIEVVAAIPAK
ncbi:RidA family protein [Asticcacaulis sp. AND118]|uniref:RidA family protein n=1 Tax=Asticcacaulis sp. AND118 TaxID=2840468 RepID=UPI001CFFBC15|nr:RidA family protein [Asticcacaulis sp. AND118]UDF03013.1 RidA family protein [Asticcacaulis sp. AND118]